MGYIPTHTVCTYIKTAIGLSVGHTLYSNSAVLRIVVTFHQYFTIVSGPDGSALLTGNLKIESNIYVS
jgi:hypothetical protein